MGLLNRLLGREKPGPSGAEPDSVSREGIPIGMLGDTPILVITEEARSQINAILGSQQPAATCLRITAQTRGKYAMNLERGDRPGLDDTVLPYRGFSIFVDPQSLTHLDGALLDWRETFGGGGFHFTPPPVRVDGRRKQVEPPAGSEGDVWRRVQAVLDEEVNPAVASHGGYIDLIDIRGDVLYVEMGGGCQGCAMSKLTLKQGVERSIQARVPEITTILDVTDHAGGANPYFRNPM